MARERSIGPEPTGAPHADAGAPLSDLFKQLAADGADLLRAEKDLAKLEIRQTAADMARDGVKVGIGIGLAAIGGLALTAFLILVVGDLLGDAYWAGALIVGALFLLVGGLLARNALKDMRRQDLTPDETIASLKQDRRFLAHEVRDFRREITS